MITYSTVVGGPTIFRLETEVHAETEVAIPVYETRFGEAQRPR